MEDLSEFDRSGILPQPWQRSLPTYKQGQITPSAVQRDFTRIIRQIGTPATEGKPRGKSPGRPLGTTLDSRPSVPSSSEVEPDAKSSNKLPNTARFSLSFRHHFMQSIQRLLSIL